MSDKFTVNGTVERTERGKFARVTLDNGHSVLGYIAGKMYKHYIRLLPGDRVAVEISSVDLSKGRIVHRY